MLAKVDAYRQGQAREDRQRCGGRRRGRQGRGERRTRQARSRPQVLPEVGRPDPSDSRLRQNFCGRPQKSRRKRRLDVLEAGSVGGGRGGGLLLRGGTPMAGARSANSGQRRRLTIDSRRSSFIAFSSSWAGRAMIDAVGDHPVDDLLAELGAHDRERPVVVLADAAGGDVGVLGGEVGAVLAALARPARGTP